MRARGIALTPEIIGLIVREDNAAAEIVKGTLLVDRGRGLSLFLSLPAYTTFIIVYEIFPIENRKPVFL